MVTPSEDFVFEVARAGQKYSFALLQSGKELGEVVVEHQPFPKLLVNRVLRSCEQDGREGVLLPGVDAVGGSVE